MMSKIKTFSDQLNELKRNTVVAINTVMNELDNLQEEGANAASQVKMFCDSPEIASAIQNAVQNTVENVIQNTIQSAVQTALQNAGIKVGNAEQKEQVENVKTFSDASNLAQKVIELVNLPQEDKTEQIEVAINAVSQVVTQLIANNLAVNTVKNAINALAVANQTVVNNSVAGAVIENVINQVDAVVQNQPKMFSDSLNEIINQQEEIESKAQQGEIDNDGQEEVDTEKGEGTVKTFSDSELSSALRRMLNKK